MDPSHRWSACSPNPKNLHGSVDVNKLSPSPPHSFNCSYFLLHPLLVLALAHIAPYCLPVYLGGLVWQTLCWLGST